MQCSLKFCILGTASISVLIILVNVRILSHLRSHRATLVDQRFTTGELNQTKYTLMDCVSYPQNDINISSLKLPLTPKYSLDNDTVPYITKSVERLFTQINKTLCEGYTVLILTPIHNSERHLKEYMNLIKSLDYPRNLLSLALGEDGSWDKTLSVARNAVKEFREIGLRRATVYSFNITGQVEGGWTVMHDIRQQHKRRSHLAKARNLLLKAALQDEDYVLWIDSDVGIVPADLIQLLLHANKDVVAPSCLFKDSNKRIRIFDKNTWRETNKSLAAQANLPKDVLVVEGYRPSNRIFLPHLKGEGRLVQLDGVGGCTLLIKARCHRKGLVFPEKLFQRHIETEGLGKLAKHMGFGVYGLPHVNVFHL